MYGQGARKVCSECHRPLSAPDPNNLSHRELRGPRNITAANIDRIFDDGGRKFLVIEEKRPNEPKLSPGQNGLLLALARVPMFTVWLARGTPQALDLFDYGSDDPWPFLDQVDFTRYQQEVSRWFASRRVTA